MKMIPQTNPDEKALFETLNFFHLCGWGIPSAPEQAENWTPLLPLMRYS